MLGARQGAIVASANAPMPDNLQAAAFYGPVMGQMGTLVPLPPGSHDGKVVVVTQEFAIAGDRQGAMSAPMVTVL